jgi:cobalt/nickel transport system permease protein
LVLQIYRINEVTKDVIIGSFCGYLLIGICSFFLFVLIDIHEPNSLSGLSLDSNLRIPQIFYFAFTCLTTLGFGDISATTIISQKLAVFTAAIGQFYIAVIVAILVSRLLHITNNKNDII